MTVNVFRVKMIVRTKYYASQVLNVFLSVAGNFSIYYLNSFFQNTLFTLPS